MRLVSQVKNGGAGQALWPRDCVSIEDLPSDLSNAIDHSYRVISWLENYQEEEIPPKWMWHLEWEIEPWFEEVNRARKSQYSSSGDEESPMEQNELAARFRD